MVLRVARGSSSRSQIPPGRQLPRDTRCPLLHPIWQWSLRVGGDSQLVKRVPTTPTPALPNRVAELPRRVERSRRGGARKSNLAAWTRNPESPLPHLWRMTTISVIPEMPTMLKTKTKTMATLLKTTPLPASRTSPQSAGRRRLLLCARTTAAKAPARNAEARACACTSAARTNAVTVGGRAFASTSV